MISVYTDGGYKKEPATCAYGVYIIMDEFVEERNGICLYGLIDHHKKTSQISEMWACKEALQYLITAELNHFPIVLYSDSSYCINTMSSWWYSWVKKGSLDSKQNIDLWYEIMDLVAEFSNIRFEWVRGHNGDIHNELVDELNQAAIGRITLQKALDNFGYMGTMKGI